MASNGDEGNDAIEVTANPMYMSCTPEDLALLAKLEEANKQIETDEKSVISGNSKGSGHSRKGSDISNNSISSRLSNLPTDQDSGNNASPQDDWVIWGRIINDWDSYAKKKATYLKDLVRKGVPHHFRALVWQLLCGAHNSPAKEMYAEYLKRTSPCEKIIKRDIARTYPEHDLFKDKDGVGQESLFNVMKAYSLQDREVGYCQGSGFIVGLLLMQMPEEECFAVLVKLMQEYRLRELFKPNMTYLGLCMYQLECMVQEQLSDLHLHFQSQSFNTSMYASHWFLTLFTTAVPLSLACRIMDLYISEGMEIIFKIGIAILMDSEQELMSCDMEGMLKFFQKDMPAKYEVDHDRLLNMAYDVKYNARKMRRLEKEYTALKTKENEEQIELRRLRTENRLLRQRIDNLEKVLEKYENATLADRLISDQVTRAQEAEETFVLKNDMSGLRQQNETLQKMLDDANTTLKDLRQRTASVTSNTSVDSQTEEVIKQLQEELVSVRLKAADQSCNVKELLDKIRELDNANRRLQSQPETEIAALQEELIAVKLREAEANLSLKEMKNRIRDLDATWQKHLERQAGTVHKEKTTKGTLQSLQDELMTVKLREAESLSELKDMKQRVMELETQNQISTHQIRRMDDENKRLKEKIEASNEKEVEFRNQMISVERKFADSESKRKEESMMTRIKNAEYSQTIAEMRQKIAELEIENQELMTAGQLHERGETQDLENRIADLQDEVLQLRMNKIKSMPLPNLNQIDSDTESETDNDNSETLSGSNSPMVQQSDTDMTASTFSINGLKMELPPDLIGNVQGSLTASMFSMTSSMHSSIHGKIDEVKPSQSDVQSKVNGNIKSTNMDSSNGNGALENKDCIKGSDVENKDQSSINGKENQDLERLGLTQIDEGDGAIEKKSQEVTA